MLLNGWHEKSVNDPMGAIFMRFQYFKIITDQLESTRRQPHHILIDLFAKLIGAFDNIW